ncbi:hypothetical protein DBV39_02075 [Orrella marina]|uniref:Uncharacterized protein n=2 Tax=Orrella marina TaxID=2163011 RepID=A0A2R4XFW2_9BURK|nr:hypothetical protein DBV39_02075 [Orrella marina]
MDKMIKGNKLRLRYFFDAGSGVCLWSGDDATEAQYGFAIDADDLPLSINTRQWLRYLIAWFDTSLDWDDAGGPARWSAEEQTRFRLAAQDGFSRLQHELASAGYDVFDESCTAGDSCPNPASLRIRIFLPAADPCDANGHHQALLTALAAFSPSTLHAPEPYWKEPGWYEHYFELFPADLATFDAIVAHSEQGWHVTRNGECDAVWNASPGHVFLLPEVIWANLFLFCPNPPAPDQEYLPS